MDLTKLSEGELDEKIELYQDRIETVSEYISDDGDPTGVLRNQLAGYRQALSMLRHEKSRRTASVQPTSSSGGFSGRDLGNIRFESTDHIRYQNGRDVSGHNMGAKRGIEVKPNIRGGEGYTVTIYNQDGNHPLWGDNVQMAPKQMRIVKQDENKVELRGFGYDPMGEPFSDYGLTIHYRGASIDRIVLHLHDRGVDIAVVE